MSLLLLKGCTHNMAAQSKRSIRYLCVRWLFGSFPRLLQTHAHCTNTHTDTRAPVNRVNQRGEVCFVSQTSNTKNLARKDLIDRILHQTPRDSSPSLDARLSAALSIIHQRAESQRRRGVCVQYQRQTFFFGNTRVFNVSLKPAQFCGHTRAHKGSDLFLFRCRLGKYKL